MKNTTETQTTEKSRFSIRRIGAIVVMIAILAGSVVFLTVTAVGRAIVFAVADPNTVNAAAQMKADYVNQFELHAQSPKE